MRLTLRHLTVMLVAVFGLAVPTVSHGQTAIDHTTFTAAVTATATNLTLTAASGSSVGDYLYVDGELMRLSTAGTSTTNWNVSRGLAQGFTPGRAHSATAIVWVIDSGTEEGPRTFNVQGTCSLATERYLPHINTEENRIFDCASNGYWIERARDIVSVQSALTVCGGRLKCREEFNQGHHIMQDDGTAKSLADAEVNYVSGSALGPITYREELAKTASSWIAINGELDISADNTTDNEGVEILFGANGSTAEDQVVELGTNGACISAMITIADISGTDQVVIGFRQNEAFQDAALYTGYSDWATIGVTATDGSINAQDEEAGAGTQTDDTGIDWADGQRRALKVCINSAGEPDFFYTANNPDNEEPIYIQLGTTNTGDALTAAEGHVPFLSFLTAGTDGPNVTISWVQLEYAP